jgi:hypothetical protein
LQVLDDVQRIVCMPIADIRSMATALLQTVLTRHAIDAAERQRLNEETAAHFQRSMPDAV